MGKVVLATGANQGLGFALVKGICPRLDADDTVYLTARNRAKGEAACVALGSVAPSLRFEYLDVTDEGSVVTMARQIHNRHGGIDIVISNAAARISKEMSPAEQVAPFIETNNHGSYRMLVHFLPLLNVNARFVGVASSFGSLTHLPAYLHPHFDIASASLEDIETVMRGSVLFPIFR